jgi:hypothetical protein
MYVSKICIIKEHREASFFKGRAHKGFARFKTYLTKLPEVVGSGVCVSCLIGIYDNATKVVDSCYFLG